MPAALVKVTMKINAFWDMRLCPGGRFDDVSREHIASIFRVEQ
jgi:hypothetical protein